MSIRMVAVELYRVISEIEKLERELGVLGPDSPEKEECEKRLFKARAEKSRLRNMLEGAKGP